MNSSLTEHQISVLADAVGILEEYRADAAVTAIYVAIGSIALNEAPPQ